MTDRCLKPDLAAKVNAYVFQDLSSMEKEEFELHLMECEDCRKKVLETQEIFFTLKGSREELARRFSLESLRAGKARNDDKNGLPFFSFLKSTGHLLSRPAVTWSVCFLVFLSLIAFHLTRVQNLKEEIRLSSGALPTGEKRRPMDSFAIDRLRHYDFEAMRLTRSADHLGTIDRDVIAFSTIPLDRIPENQRYAGVLRDSQDHEIKPAHLMIERVRPGGTGQTTEGFSGEASPQEHPSGTLEMYNLFLDTGGMKPGSYFLEVSAIDQATGQETDLPPYTFAFHLK